MIRNNQPNNATTKIRKVQRWLIRQHLLPDLSRKKAFRLARQSLLEQGDLSSAEKTMLKTVSLEVSPSDMMYVRPRAGHYLWVGLSALRCLEEVIRAAGRTAPIRSVLDFPSGHGRVLRFLRARFPEAHIVASEVNRGALGFCRRQFGVETLLSRKDLANIRLTRQFDLVWCGSLITHLDEIATTELLAFFYRNLAAGGMCVFTTHGQCLVERMREAGSTYRLGADERQKVLSGYENNGYGYADYGRSQGYGVSAISYEHMTELARKVGPWTEVWYRERGWDNHQDVYAFVASR